MRVKDETKQLAIVENTLDVVFKRGFAGIKMADLANRVGLSVSTLYVYYRNKEDLIVSIAIGLIERETQRSEQEITEDLPYKLKLKMLWLFWINFSINKEYRQQHSNGHNRGLNGGNRKINYGWKNRVEPEKYRLYVLYGLGCH